MLTLWYEGSTVNVMTEDLSGLVSGDNTSVLAGLGHSRHLAPHSTDRAPGAGSLHGPGHTPRGEPASGEALVLLLSLLLFKVSL